MIGKQRPRTHNKQDGGYTLIEVMIALVILLIGLSGLLGMHISGLQATQRSRQYGEASALGEAKIEELRLVKWAAHTAFTTPNNFDVFTDSDEVNARGVSGGTDFKYRRVWTITRNPLFATDPVPLSFDIVLRIEWNERNDATVPLAVILKTEVPNL